MNGLHYLIKPYLCSCCNLIKGNCTLEELKVLESKLDQSWDEFEEFRDGIASSMYQAQMEKIKDPSLLSIIVTPEKQLKAKERKIRQRRATHIFSTFDSESVFISNDGTVTLKNKYNPYDDVLCSISDMIYDYSHKLNIILQNKDIIIDRGPNSEDERDDSTI